MRISFRCQAEEATAFVYNLGAPVSFASGINTAWYPQVEDHRVNDTGWSGLRATGTITFVLHPDLLIYTAGRTDGPSARATRFTFDVPIYFAFSAGRYRVLESSSQSAVTAYVLRERENETDFVEGSAAVLNVLEASFGEYPYSRFAVVEVPTEVAYAADFAGASLDGFILATTSFLDRRFNTAYFGHEIGHQWWGNLMTTSGDRGSMMLSEGMSQFGSLLAVEAIDGAEAAERYRRIGYPGYIRMQSGLGYLTLAAAGFDQTIPEANAGASSRIIADGKGFQVWNMLADQVGQDRFARALKQLVGRYKLIPIAWDDFLNELEHALGEDLQWFYDQWFGRTGAPDPSLQWQQDGERLTVVIVQSEPAYQLRLEIDVVASGGVRETHIVTASGPTTTVELEVPHDVSSVSLDPRFRILRWTQEYREAANALADPTKALLSLRNGEQAEAAEILGAALARMDLDTEVDIHGRRFLIEMTLGRLLADQEKYEEARVHLEAALMAPSRIVDELPWTYFLLGKAALNLENESLLQEVRRAIVSADIIAGGAGAPQALAEEIARH